MTFLQQVGNKWPCVREALQNHVGKATVQQTRRRIDLKKKICALVKNVTQLINVYVCARA